MATYRIAEVREGAVWDWVVILVDDDGSQDWVSRYPTKAEAQAMADRLAAGGTAERTSP